MSIRIICATVTYHKSHLTMRNHLRIFIASTLISFAANAQDARYDTIRYARDHYDERVAVFQSEPVQTGRTIFLGNSLVEYGNWKRLLKDSSVVNRGIAADNTFGVLDRLDDVIKRKPARLFIEIGINDISQNIPVAVIAKNIQSIVERVLAGSKTKIYVHGLLPTNDNVKNDYPELFGKEDQVNKLNELLRLNASKYRYSYIDLGVKLKGKNGKLSEKFAEPDGLHLNTTGYEVWVGLLKKMKVL
jgi:lysophospholipase L1-like esterase